MSNNQLIKEVGISPEGRKQIRIRYADKKESVESMKSARLQEQERIDFEYNEMNKKYSYQL
jgi:hypothetical protein